MQEFTITLKETDEGWYYVISITDVTELDEQTRWTVVSPMMPYEHIEAAFTERLSKLL